MNILMKDFMHNLFMMKIPYIEVKDIPYLRKIHNILMLDR